MKIQALFSTAVVLGMSSLAMAQPQATDTTATPRIDTQGVPSHVARHTVLLSNALGK
jgi:hypothetical protein